MSQKSNVVKYNTADVAAPTALTGATVVLTGATSPGIGAALLEGLLAGGAAKIFMLARTVSKAEAAAAKYGAGDRIEVIKADLSKLADVEKASQEIAAKGVPINILMLNAATMNSSGGASPPGQTSEGLEESFAVNVAAPHLMTRLLIPSLAPNARVIVTGSDAGGLVKWKMDFDNLSTLREGDGQRRAHAVRPHEAGAAHGVRRAGRAAGRARQRRRLPPWRRAHLARQQRVSHGGRHRQVFPSRLLPHAQARRAPTTLARGARRPPTTFRI